MSFTQRAERVTASLPTVPRTPIAVRPATGLRTGRFTVSFTAPDAGGRKLGFLAFTGSTKTFTDSLDSLVCSSITPLGRQAAGAPVRAPLDAAGPWCKGKNVGVVVATYGTTDEGACKATPLPCAGVLDIGTFSFRVTRSGARRR